MTTETFKEAKEIIERLDKLYSLKQILGSVYKFHIQIGPHSLTVDTNILGQEFIQLMYESTIEEVEYEINELETILEGL